MRLPNVLLIALIAATTMHCSSSTSTSSCSNIAGKWSVSGCASFQCNVTQSDCAVSIGCPLISYTGSVSGDSVSFDSFASDGGVTQTCQGTLSGMTITGKCSSGGAPCTFAAVKQ